MRLELIRFYSEASKASVSTCSTNQAYVRTFKKYSTILYKELSMEKLGSNSFLFLYANEKLRGGNSYDWLSELGSNQHCRSQSPMSLPIRRSENIYMLFPCREAYTKLCCKNKTIKLLF